MNAFETQWASHCHRTHALAVNNGTAALELAVHCLNLPPGSEVILPDFTIISCVRAVLSQGLIPVFVDVDPITWNLRSDAARAALTDRTAALMPVHMYGLPVDMDPLLSLAEAHQLKVIEDAAEAHGAVYRGRPCGSFGDISVFSFYANKIVTTGEGGMILFDNPAFLAPAQRYRELGFDPERRFRSSGPGANLRFTALQAAVGLAQIEKLDESLARKQHLAQRYREGLGDVPGLQHPVSDPDSGHVYWMYGIVLDESLQLDGATLIQRLHALGVDSRPFFLGMHEQPYLHQLGYRPSPEAFPVSRRLARQGVYLPSGTTLTDSEIDRVIEAVHTVLR